MSIYFTSCIASQNTHIPVYALFSTADASARKERIPRAIDRAHFSTTPLLRGQRWSFQFWLLALCLLWIPPFLVSPWLICIFYVWWDAYMLHFRGGIIICPPQFSRKPAVDIPDTPIRALGSNLEVAVLLSICFEKSIDRLCILLTHSKPRSAEAQPDV